ncbi:hypothetical protein [Streptomyces sp. 135]|uniref:hypothetical protein n=1 Tax=Streptomyces sp. 135 TaxID=2838850 RepID=UPI001CBEC6F0|nr:hypothetical protein [Streptomyces sp. 135]
MSLVASPAAAAPTASPAAATTARPGDTCTAADLGTRKPYIKSTEVSPTITHFKGWFVTEGTTGNQVVTTSTQTVISVSVGVTGGLEGSFPVQTLTAAGATLGLSVKVDASSTSTESNAVTWNFNQPGYYGVYKGTKKVTGTYASLNCNRVQQSGGGWALKWIEGPGGGNFTTFTTVEEGAVRCQDSVPANSIMAKAQSLLDCGSPAAKAERPAGAVPPTAKQERDRLAQRQAATGGKVAGQPKAGGPGAKAGAPSAKADLSCGAELYRIGVPGRPLFWGAPHLRADSVRLRPSTIFSGNLDQWRLCNVTERDGVIEATLWNLGNQACATIPVQSAGADQAPLMMAAPCTEDDLQRFYIYRDVPGSSKIGVQNKYTGSMMGHDRYADGESVRQYSSGRQDGTGTYTLNRV